MPHTKTLESSGDTYRCDVTRAEDLQAAMARTVEAFGRLDFAFNNAGIEPRKPAPMADYEEEDWNRILDINLRGVFLCLKHEIPLILHVNSGFFEDFARGGTHAFVARVGR